MKNKINKKLLLNEKGFSWHTRYSSDENTDDIGRWARIGYYNGLCIAWIDGFVKGENERLDHKRIGEVDVFIVILHFPTSSQQVSGSANFKNIDDAKKYVEEMFTDFKKIINQ